MATEQYFLPMHFWSGFENTYVLSSSCKKRVAYTWGKKKTKEEEEEEEEEEKGKEGEEKEKEEEEEKEKEEEEREEKEKEEEEKEEKCRGFFFFSPSIIRIEYLL